MKLCSKCKVEFEPTESQIKKRDIICRPCQNARDSASYYRRKEAGTLLKRKAVYKPESYLKRKNSEDGALKLKARDAVQRNIKNGKLKKQNCVICGDINTQAHHDDYSRPLDVVWFCYKHHLQHHLKEGKFSWKSQ